MAKQIAAFPEGTRTRNGYSRYPWDKWLDGKVWELTGGEDFTVPSKSFRSAAAQAAVTRGGEIKTAVLKVAMENGDTREDVVIQYIEKAPTATDEDLTSDSNLAPGTMDQDMSSEDMADSNA